MPDCVQTAPRCSVTTASSDGSPLSSRTARIVAKVSLPISESLPYALTCVLTDRIGRLVKCRFVDEVLNLSCHSLSLRLSIPALYMLVRCCSFVMKLCVGSLLQLCDEVLSKPVAAAPPINSCQQHGAMPLHYLCLRLVCGRVYALRSCVTVCVFLRAAYTHL